ncbi:uncharacterized protein LOC107615789 [Arachis ipaensis]|uniref:uncharacterized protein LOC107615789 n=1 Tax=Arachis ipaensis TaxID=130454 RepID=UPI0007AF660E|nr:uncharacterized protein LOC107615789 [Arachis ipaensis]XP_025678745.1 uncharacterized protein LOC112778661 [Arachis hypogaea]
MATLAKAFSRLAPSHFTPSNLDPPPLPHPSTPKSSIDAITLKGSEPLNEINSQPTLPKEESSNGGKNFVEDGKEEELEVGSHHEFQKGLSDEESSQAGDLEDEEDESAPPNPHNQEDKLPHQEAREDLKPLPPHVKHVSLMRNINFRIFLEEGAKPVRQPQRRLNPTILDVVKEVTRLLEAEIIYPISDSEWVSPVQVVPKKSGVIMVKTESGELLATRVQNTWRVCTDYHRLNQATRNDHYLFLFIDQMLDRLAGNLARVLERCTNTNLVLNFEKCHFMVKQGIVLGHIVFKDGISVDQAKIDVISSLPYPSSMREIRSFLGHAGFYRRFIEDFSKVALPLSHLLQKDVEFYFGEDCKKAFDKLKEALTTAPIVRGPSWNQPF